VNIRPRYLHICLVYLSHSFDLFYVYVYVRIQKSLKWGLRVCRPSKVTCGPLFSIQCLQCGEYLENIYFFGYIMQIFGSIELRIWVQRVMHLLRPRWPSKNPMARSTDMHRWHKYKY